jgi:hypothetical protein
MSKVFKAASSILSVVALIPGPQQPFVQAAAVLTGIGAALTAKKPAIEGQQSEWQSDPSAASIIAIGRTYVGGNIIYRKSWGEKNKYRTMVTILSGCGPIEGIEGTYGDKKLLVFDGETAHGKTYNRYWSTNQLGACPEATALTTSRGSPPGWTADHKVSGHAAAMDTFLFDGEGKDTFTQHPELGRVLLGVKAYDARLDSTYPGGSGSCRSDDQTTWPYSENPFVIGMTFALGWRQGPNSVRVGGVGMPIKRIDVAAFVEGANVADANGWKVGGQISTRDDKWEALKAILQAGGGEPVRHGALLSCIVNSPKISLATITLDQLVAEGSVATAQSTRDRVNGIIPRYRSEDHSWEVVPASCIRNADFLADDGKEKTKEIEYPLVQCAAGQQPAQAAQLAAYDLWNSREMGPIVLPLKLRWFGYRGGDCLTVEDRVEFGQLRGRKVLVLRRGLDQETASAPLTFRTETAAKHIYALSQDGTAAPTTDLGELPDLDAPDVSEWAMNGATVAGDGSAIPALVFTGAQADGVASTIVFSYYQGEEAPVDEEDWIVSAIQPGSTSQHVNTQVGSGLPYMGSVQYVYRSGTTDRLVLGPVTAGAFSFGSGAHRLLTQTVASPVSSDDDSISIVAFDGVIDDGRSVSFPADTLAGLASGTNFGVFWSLTDEVYHAAESPALDEMADSDNVFVRWFETSDGGDYSPPPDGTPGDGGYQLPNAIGS